MSVGSWDHRKPRLQPTGHSVLKDAFPSCLRVGLWQSLVLSSLSPPAQQPASLPANLKSTSLRVHFPMLPAKLLQLSPVNDKGRISWQKKEKTFQIVKKNQCVHPYLRGIYQTARMLKSLVGNDAVFAFDLHASRPSTSNHQPVVSFPIADDFIRCVLIKSTSCPSPPMWPKPQVAFLC